KQERRRLVGDDEHRFETPQHPVGAPVTSEFHSGALEVSAVLLELRFESGEEREGIGGRAGEHRKNRVVAETAETRRTLLHHGIAECYLAIARKHRTIAVSQREDCRRTYHSRSMSSSPIGSNQPPLGIVLGRGRATDDRHIRIAGRGVWFA